jgi:V/A-type H+-transporting ATPase subunit D
MAVIQVNPTRMELTKLKKRLVVARRGHKLLKDKRDELMKQFLELVKRNRELRMNVEKKIMDVHRKFLLARAVMPAEVLGASVMLSKISVGLEVSEKNIMSVNVPTFHYDPSVPRGSNIFPYGFADTSGELDGAISAMYEALPDMLALAEVEKAVHLLADEIEKTRRRVNALEHVLIPQLTDTIKYISMKLEENERGNLTRLMKVKDMMLEEARKKASQ